ncbi:MAG: hypothetical protein VW230_00245 [Candidatus Poseidoniales archaeon]|jgi:hypothetical protein
MGRSVPTWRRRIEYELDRLQPFRRALPNHEKEIFDSMMNSIRQRRSSGGLLPSHDIVLPLVLSLLLEAWGKIHSLERSLQQLESTQQGEHVD